MGQIGIFIVLSVYAIAGLLFSTNLKLDFITVAGTLCVNPFMSNLNPILLPLAQEDEGDDEGVSWME